MDKRPIVELLCSYPLTDIDQTNLNGSTPLFGACQRGHFDCARVLLARGANPNARQTTSGGTPLRVATSKGYANIVRLLLGHGAERAPTDAFGNTPLDVATTLFSRLPGQAGYLECARFLAG
mmetsp:Transcript_24204/g.74612  ORF Transcript_24204/g.74612 Transcript_24204/m.74612 type:complete len:122 (-) Transcript_24204:75-440(-)